MSHFELEERGLNAEHFEQANSHSNSGTYDSEPVTSVQEMIEPSNSAELKQYTRYVHITDSSFLEPSD